MARRVTLQRACLAASSGEQVERMARVPIAHDALGCLAASPAYQPFVQPTPTVGRAYLNAESP